jgi:hypothetical protein
VAPHLKCAVFFFFVNFFDQLVQMAAKPCYPVEVAVGVLYDFGLLWRINIIQGSVTRVNDP